MNGEEIKIQFIFPKWYLGTGEYIFAIISKFRLNDRQDFFD